MGFLSFLFKNLFKKSKKPTVKSIFGADKELVQKKWREVEEQVKLGKPSNFKSAIIAADKILYFTLDKMGYKGSLGEKLIASREKFSDYQGIWSAHKFRNRLVHEVEHEFFIHEAQKAIEQYQRALKDLHAL